MDTENPNLSEYLIRNEALDDVISKTKADLETTQELYRGKLNELWQESMAFSDEMSDFCDRNGLLSPWWNAQILALQDPSIQHTAVVRQQKKIKNEEMEVKIKVLEEESKLLKEQVLQVKHELECSQKELQQLKNEKEFLLQEPYGLEFRNLKAAVEANRLKCYKKQEWILHKDGEVINFSATTSGRSVGVLENATDFDHPGNYNRTQLTDSTNDNSGELIKHTDNSSCERRRFQVLKMCEKRTTVLRHEKLTVDPSGK